MGDDDTNETDDDVSATEAAVALAISNPYKILGDIDNSNGGIGVLGRNQASSGTTKGVEGRVNSSSGYGLFTPDDAKVEGTADLATADVDNLTVNSTLNLNRLVDTTDIAHSAITSSKIENRTIRDQDLYAANLSDGDVFKGDGTGVTAGPPGTVNASSFSLEVSGYTALTLTKVTDDNGNGSFNVGVGEQVAHNYITDGPAGATISGGRANDVSDNYSTVSGGRNNEAGNGGSDNDPTTAHYASVGGGRSNKALAPYATIPGGRDNFVDGDYSFEAGRNNTAAGDDSFAAGRKAKIDSYNDGCFVWADGNDSEVTSTAPNQFIVEASGGAGFGTTDPVSQLHVQENVAETGSNNLGRHAAAIENTNNGDSGTPDALGIQLTNISSPGQYNNFISFMDSGGTIGSVQGDGSGNVTFASSSSDLAEYFPKADPESDYAKGTVVGLQDGEVVADPTTAETALVVSTTPLVAGNVPDYADQPEDEAASEDEAESESEQNEEYVCLALLGQVPVAVESPVDAGDRLIATADGKAVPASETTRDGPVVGRALTAATDAEDTVEALVSHHDPGTTDETVARLQDELAEKDECIDDLERENDQLRDRTADLEDENEALRERLQAVEEAIGIDPDGADPSPSPADD